MTRRIDSTHHRAHLVKTIGRQSTLVRQCRGVIAALNATAAPHSDACGTEPVSQLPLIAVEKEF
jgi:hypothetical protein